MAIIVGSNAPESLNGTNDHDVINALGGNDTINAGSLTAAQPGEFDVVDGGDGTDTLVVNAAGETQGVQLFVGTSPTFEVRSTSGNFFVDAYKMELIDFTGGSGNDEINTREVGGKINGGAGIDLWSADLRFVFTNISFTLGTTGSILAAGLTSIANIDRINLATGIGNDVITGGAEGDTITTGEGNDTINAETRPTAGGSAVDVVDGQEDIDTLVVDATGELSAVQLSVGSSPTFAVRSGSGRFFVDAYNMEIINFTGGAGDDTINTGRHSGRLNGGGGTNHWIADLSTLFTDITYNLNVTKAIGAADLDSILNIDRITLTTGSGNDIITGGAQADSITTGNGNDRIDARSRPTAEGSSIDVVDGQRGNDTLVVNASTETKSVQLFVGSSPTFAVRSNSGKFFIDAYAMETIEFTGGAAADDIRTGNHGGKVNGGQGNDFWTADLSGVLADISFELGVTNAIASAGLTSILNLEGISLATGSGDDKVIGGAQADNIVTNNGNDTINAETRPTVAGSGIDVVDGGLGQDKLVVDASAETKTVDLFVGLSPVFAVRSASGRFFVDAYSMETIDFTGGAGADNIRSGDHAGAIDGGGGMDSWIADLGGQSANIFYAVGPTNEIASAGLTIDNIERIELITGTGNDTIDGGTLADVITTGNGNDVIDAKTRPTVAGSGIDVVDGGLGHDTLLVEASTQTTAVNVFAGSSPNFAVRSASGKFFVDAYSMERLIFLSGSGADAVTGLAGHDDITTGGGNDTLTGNDGNDFLRAGAGDDELRGGRGIDQLTGGVGIDRFIYDVFTQSSVAKNSVDFLIDFTPGVDEIDVSGIDANSFSTDGNQAFTFIGGQAFHGVRGELRSIAGRLEADLNGDAIADFRLNLSNNKAAGLGDIVL